MVGAVLAEKRIFNLISVPIAVARNPCLQTLGLVPPVEKAISLLLFALNVVLKNQIRPGIALVVKKTFNLISVPTAATDGVKRYADLRC